MNPRTQSLIGKTDVAVTRLGFGASTLGNLYRRVDDETARATATAAWDNGIRYFDTAPHYGFGLSERRLGDVLREREGYVLSTKVGRLLAPCPQAGDKMGFCSPMPFESVYDYSYDAVMRSFEDSQQRLGLSRIDILYMHDIGRVTHGDRHEELFAVAMNGGYRAMSELRDQGLVRAIGLGVNEYEVCEQAMAHGDFDCFLLAGRYTLLEQEPLESFFPACSKRGISIVIGGPYNSGILATGTKSRQALTYNYESAPRAVVEKARRIEQCCDEYRVALAAAALQFTLGHPVVASVIPGLGNPERVAKTIDFAQTPIPGELWQELKRRGLLHADAPVPEAMP
ncbi:MAG TPA: aldo/keto reductase [Gammaproteobacteria bacterium]|nr:aldo/keto reductase [Gammaproteobacteria bacterium]